MGRTKRKRREDQDWNGIFEYEQRDEFEDNVEDQYANPKWLKIQTLIANYTNALIKEIQKKVHKEDPTIEIQEDWQVSGLRHARGKIKTLLEKDGALLLAIQKVEALMQLSPTKPITVNLAEELSQSRSVLPSFKGRQLVGKMKELLSPSNELMFLVQSYQNDLAREIRDAVLSKAHVGWRGILNVTAADDLHTIAVRFIDHLRPLEEDEEHVSQLQGVSKKLQVAAKKYQALIKVESVLNSGQELKREERKDLEKDIKAGRGFFGDSRKGKKVAKKIEQQFKPKLGG